MSPERFRPSVSDVAKMKQNLVILIARTLTEHIPSLAAFSEVVPKHIVHRYSAEMSKKSEVAVLDILMKNEAKHTDMLDIMNVYQGYLGENYPDDLSVVSGGDLMTCEWEEGAQRHMMCGNTVKDRLELLRELAQSCGTTWRKFEAIK